MKIRLPKNSNLASLKMKGVAYGILLMLTFFIPQLANTQDKPSAARPTQTAAAGKTSAANPTVGTELKAQPEKAAPASTSPTRLSDVQISSEGGATTVIITADQSVTPQRFRLNNPRRLVLDFPNSKNDIAATSFPVQDASIKQLRVRQFQTEPSPIVRMVFDLQADSETPDIAIGANQVKVSFNSNKGQAATEPQKAQNAEEKPVQAALTAKPASNPAKPASNNEDATIVPVAFKVPAKDANPVVAPAPATPAPVKKEEKPVVAAAPVTVPQVPVPTKAAEPVKPAQDKPALVAALAPTAVPVARSIPNSSSRYTGQPLTLEMVKVPLLDFFRLMADEGGINIVIDPSVKGDVTIHVVKMPWDQIFDAVLANNGLDKRVEGSMVRVASKATLQDEAKQDEALKKAHMLAADLETRIKRLNYAKASDLKKTINDQKTARGTIMVDERTNSLILSDIAVSLDKLTTLIESLDIPQPQVEIEARIVEATRNFARDIGVQFGFIQGNLQRVTVGGPNSMAFGKNGTSAVSRPSGKPDGDGGMGGTGDTTDSNNLNVNLPAKTPFGGIGISVGNIFDTFLLDAAITAGEAKGWAKLISQPKVVAQNNHEAIVTNGMSFPVAVNQDNTVTIQFFDAALTLTATPQITYEGNVLLDLKVQNNTADFGYTSIGGVPTIRKNESTTRILVSDGGTTMIGGVLQDNDGSSEDKVPGLGSLPVLGNLFRRTSTTRDSTEVLFFVTPRIVK